MPHTLNSLLCCIQHESSIREDQEAMVHGCLKYPPSETYLWSHCIYNWTGPLCHSVVPGWFMFCRLNLPREHALYCIISLIHNSIYTWLTTIAYEGVCNWEYSTGALECSEPQDLCTRDVRGLFVQNAELYVIYLTYELIICGFWGFPCV